MLDGTILSVKQTGDLKFSRESKISLQISWRTESESGYVWTWKFLNPERKICGFKKYPDTSERELKVPSHCHLDKVWERHSCDNGKEICQKVRCTFRFFFSVYQCGNLLHVFFIFTLPSPSSWLFELPSSVTMQNNYWYATIWLKSWRFDG